MNYYEHHLGDYLRDTAHLSLVEDAIYRRLLDQYYIREKPLPVGVDDCCKLARVRGAKERKAVEYILKMFFVFESDGFHQLRADQEIERYNSKQIKARASANARWAAYERNANAMRTHSEGNALQSPDTSIKSRKVADAPAPKSVKARKPSKTTLPESFAFTPELAAYAVKNLPDVDAQGLFDKFVGQAKAKAWEYADWSQAFQTYVRNTRADSGHWSSGQYPKATGTIKW